MSGCEACVLFLITARIIGPSSCTREHEASIGKREMSLTMCGRVQLTSEARYKYSDVAHCPSLMLCRTQNLCDHGGPAQAECTSSHPRVCARNASGCISDNNATNAHTVSLSYNYSRCCWEGFFFFPPNTCQPYFTKKGGVCWSPKDRLNDTSAVETIIPTRAQTV